MADTSNEFSKGDLDICFKILNDINSQGDLNNICKALDVPPGTLNGNSCQEKGQSLYHIIRLKGQEPELVHYLRKEYKRRFPTSTLIEQNLRTNPINTPIAPIVPDPVRKKRSPCFLLTAIIVLTVLATFIGIFIFNGRTTPSSLPQSLAPINFLIPLDKKYGVCTTTCAFDYARIDAIYKTRAFSPNPQGGPLFHLNWAIETDIADAEAKILVENITVINQNPSRYITAGIAVTLNHDDTTSIQSDDLEVSAGRDALQGAYVAQKEYNNSHPNNPLVLAIISLGDTQALRNYGLQEQIAQKLGQIVMTNPTFIGIIGLPFGSDFFISLLNTNNTSNDPSCKENIPLISIAPYDGNTTPFYCFHSITPSMDEVSRYTEGYIGSMATSYIQGKDLAKENFFIYLVYPDKNTYSQELQDSLATTIKNDAAFPFGSQSSSYDTNPNTEIQSLEDVATRINTKEDNLSKITPVVFLGSPNDAIIFRQSLNANIPLIGSDNMFKYVHLPSDQKKLLLSPKPISFFAFAFEDQWMGKAPFQPTITNSSIPTSYSQLFDVNHSRTGSYSYERADDTALLSDDALTLLISAGERTIEQKNCKSSGERCNLTSQECKLLHPINTSSARERRWAYIQSCTPNVAFQGASGQIAFSGTSSAFDDYNPIDKSFLILEIDKDARSSQVVTHSIANYGTFAISK